LWELSSKIWKEVPPGAGHGFELNEELNEAKKRRDGAGKNWKKKWAAEADIEALKQVATEKGYDIQSELPRRFSNASAPPHEDESDAESVAAASQAKRVFIVDDSTDESGKKRKRDGYYYVEISAQRYNKRCKEHVEHNGRFYEVAENQTGRKKKLQEINSPGTATKEKKPDVTEDDFVYPSRSVEQAYKRQKAAMEILKESEETPVERESTRTIWTITTTMTTRTTRTTRTTLVTLGSFDQRVEQNNLPNVW